MAERNDIVKMKGNPVTLLGTQIEVGQKAPDFCVVNDQLKPVTLGDFAGKVKIISVTPSLDTPVCDLQLRRFNSEAAALGDGVVVMNISMDLPFAIRRFCAAAEISNAIALSDHREASFGLGYGMLIKELRLLARAVFVIDATDTVIYKDICAEATDHPNYDAAIALLKK